MIERDPHAFFVSIMFSTVCHLLFFVGAMYLIGIKSDVKPLTHDTVIDISLVSLPEKVETPVMPVKKIKPIKEDIPTETVVVPKKKLLKKKAIQKKKVKTVKVKRSLKKKTYKETKIRQSALKAIEKKVKETKKDPIEEALSRLKKEVESSVPPTYTAEGNGNEKEEKNQIEKKISNDDVKRPFEQSPTATEGVRSAPTLIEIYRVEIAYQIQRNWAFAKSMAGGQTNLKAELVFKVMPDGKISDAWFETRSGNAYFDDAAHKAIMKSNPVAPHPEGLNEPFIIIGLRFDPEGLW